MGQNLCAREQDCSPVDEGHSGDGTFIKTSAMTQCQTWHYHSIHQLGINKFIFWIRPCLYSLCTVYSSFITVVIYYILHTFLSELSTVLLCVGLPIRSNSYINLQVTLP